MRAGARRGYTLVPMDPAARILARKFEPELIAIDGLYKTADDLGGSRWGQSVQARLEGDSIVLVPLE